MTPVPLDLPLRPAEATELANLIFEHAERKPLTDELRSRLAARAAVLKLESITPYFGSLERDPVHPSAYYLAVDGPDSPQLLYLALATAPTSSIYHIPLLIECMRRLNGPEVVINATPRPADRENVEAFCRTHRPAFYLQPQEHAPSPGYAPAAFAFSRPAQRPVRTLPRWQPIIMLRWAAIRAAGAPDTPSPLITWWSLQCRLQPLRRTSHSPRPV